MCRGGKSSEGCTHCGGRGVVRIKTCPLKFIGRQTWTMASLSRFADKGAWPIGGGTLEQTESFLQFYERWTSTLARLKAESDGES